MIEQQLSIDETLLEKETNYILNKIIVLLSNKKIYPNKVQQQMLSSHMRAMILRSYTGELLPEIDISLFEDISPLSLKLAKQVVGWLNNLADEEAYLLSVHFEVAKENELSGAIGE